LDPACFFPENRLKTAGLAILTYFPVWLFQKSVIEGYFREFDRRNRCAFQKYRSIFAHQRVSTDFFMLRQDGCPFLLDYRTASGLFKKEMSVKKSRICLYDRLPRE
jgi:hypothetical protein